MQPNQEQPQEWQQPQEFLSNAPYVTPVEDDLSSAPQATLPREDMGSSSDASSTTKSITKLPELDEGNDDAVLQWEGTEYFHHERSVTWYVVTITTTVILVLIAVFLLKSVTFAILIPVMVVALFVYVRRPPEIMHYTLSRKGLHINDKLYSYDQFKSFGVVSHDNIHSVNLTPRKRFQISQIVYFPEELGEQIVDMFAARLPMKELQPDLIDRLLTRLHL